MRTTFHDKVSSLLIALLILGGVVVAVMFGLWLSAQVFAKPRAVAVALVPQGDGSGMEDVEEFDANVLTPSSEFVQEETTLLEDLEAVVDLVAKNPAIFSESALMDDSLLLPGGKSGDGRTRGDGIGQAGRKRRWEFNFEQAVGVDEYARMLDSFGIELGILQEGGKVIYVSQLATDRPRVREGASVEEKRYYMTWLKGDREMADRELLDKAGVDHQGRFVLKFLPFPLEAELEAMEKSRAGVREQALKGSFFRVIQEEEGNYKFYLYHQVF